MESLFAYAGRQSSYNSKIHYYYPVVYIDGKPQLDESRKQITTSKKLCKNQFIGHLLRIEESEGDIIRYNPNQLYIDVVDYKISSQWQIADKAIALMEAKMKENKDPLLKALEPVRVAYRNAVGVHKTAILAEAVRFITK